MIYPLQHYTNKIVYNYLENIDITRYKNDIIIKNTEYEWIYDIYLMSDMKLCVDITAITPDNRYSIRQSFTHTFIYQVPVTVKHFAQMTIERMFNEIEQKYRIKIYDGDNKQKLTQMFINDFWNVYEREYFNYFGQ